MIQENEHIIEQTRDEAARLLDELEKAQEESVERTLSSPSSDLEHTWISTNSVRGSFSIPWLIVGSFGFIAIVSVLAVIIVLNATDHLWTKEATISNSEADTGGRSTESRMRLMPQAAMTASPKAIRDDQQLDSKTELSTTSGTWEPTSKYKFGRLPDSTYPDSCAFSQTDLAGQAIISRSNVDYWACKDEGGNSTDGFSVLWADGKRSKYLFGPGGTGTVVGTNRQTYPMRWRNEIKNGTEVIVISHESGATSWIPGHVN
jgi:hypothetical protein